jgi:hypothetical protein
MQTTFYPHPFNAFLRFCMKYINFWRKKICSIKLNNNLTKNKEKSFRIITFPFPITSTFLPQCKMFEKKICLMATITYCCCLILWNGLNDHFLKITFNWVRHVLPLIFFSLKKVRAKRIVFPLKNRKKK